MAGKVGFIGLGAMGGPMARNLIKADVPLVPVGIGGSYWALPAGAWFPRPRKIVVRVGEPFRLERRTDAAVAAERIA